MDRYVVHESNPVHVVETNGGRKKRTMFFKWRPLLAIDANDSELQRMGKGFLKNIKFAGHWAIEIGDYTWELKRDEATHAISAACVEWFDPVFYDSSGQSVRTEHPELEKSPCGETSRTDLEIERNAHKVISDMVANGRRSKFGSLSLIDNLVENPAQWFSEEAQFNGESEAELQDEYDLFFNNCHDFVIFLSTELSDTKKKTDAFWASTPDSTTIGNALIGSKDKPLSSMAGFIFKKLLGGNSSKQDVQPEPQYQADSYDYGQAFMPTHAFSSNAPNCASHAPSYQTLCCMRQSQPSQFMQQPPVSWQSPQPNGHCGPQVQQPPCSPPSANQPQFSFQRQFQFGKQRQSQGLQPAQGPQPGPPSPRPAQNGQAPNRPQAGYGNQPATGPPFGQPNRPNQQPQPGFRPQSMPVPQPGQRPGPPQGPQLGQRIQPGASPQPGTGPPPGQGPQAGQRFSLAQRLQPGPNARPGQGQRPGQSPSPTPPGGPFQQRPGNNGPQQNPGANKPAGGFFNRVQPAPGRPNNANQRQPNKPQQPPSRPNPGRPNGAPARGRGGNGGAMRGMPIGRGAGGGGGGRAGGAGGRGGGGGGGRIGGGGGRGRGRG